MLKCRDVSELAHDLLDGGLPLRGRLAVHFHLAICSMCRAYLDQLRKTRALLGRRPLDPPAPQVEDAVIARITDGGRGAE